MDYSLLRIDQYQATELEALPEWDIFISAYNESQRVITVFDSVRAQRKEWVIHPEYDFEDGELPKTGVVRVLHTRDEAEFWHDYFSEADFHNLPRDSRICVDVTGFMRPHLMLLPRMLRLLGFAQLDIVYSDPREYQSGEKTQFSKGAVTEVRQIRGFEGTHLPSGDEDLLVIGAGYDDDLIRRVSEDKRAARKLMMFGLPSLQPHMYEENRLRAARAEEAVGPLPARSLLFAPANNPFATAQELHDKIQQLRSTGFTNLYFSPLGTKAQALGFALYYLCECVGSSASVVFPFAEYYTRETSIGLARVWCYRVELDWLNV